MRTRYLTAPLALLLVVLGMLLLGVVPAGASSPIFEVNFDVVSATSGSGTYYISGSVTGNETGAAGTVDYYHPYQPGRVNPYEARTRLEDLECMAVVPSTSSPGDYNLLVIGRLVVLQDDGNLYEGRNWGGFAYAPDEYRFGGIRPFTKINTFVDQPSCVPEEFFWYTNPPGLWHTSGYFKSGYINIEIAPYSCQGFEPPMNLAYLPPAMGGGLIGRKVKKNRVLPFKALLIDEDGNIVTDVVSPPAIQVEYDDSLGGPAVDVTDDALSNGKGTDGNEFELSEDKWHYNLKTKNYSAVGTYTATMVSGDSSEYVVDPTCEGVFVIEQR